MELHSTDIDEKFDGLIKKHHDLTESLKNVDLILEGIELIIYNLLRLLYQTHLLNLQSG